MLAKNWYTIFPSVLMFLLMSGSSFGQKTVVKGRVIDAVTKEGIGFSTIKFQDSKIGVVTDIDGYYSIETYYATDSLQISYMGYKKMTKGVLVDKSQEINFELIKGQEELPEIVIKAKKRDDPALVLFRKIIKNKKINNRIKLDAYEYETYNKIELDLNNWGDKFKKRRFMKSLDFIWDHIDSLETGEKFLPVFLTETISDYHYRKDPSGQKEIVKASRISGIENESISQFLGQMYQNINIYDNNLLVFSKGFVSPISAFGNNYYRYYLTDSASMDGYWCYKLEYYPRRKGDPCFKGEMWIHDTTYAVKQLECEISELANINFVQGLKVKQVYEQVEDEVWMLRKEKLFVDFSLTDNSTGFFGKRTTTYKDFKINQPRDVDFYKSLENVTVLKGANKQSDDYWVKNRHEELDKNEKAVYHLTDTVKNLPIFKTSVDIIETIVTGYKLLGPLRLGPYSSLYSFNIVEGSRFRLGLRTNNSFSNKWLLEGHGAYGLKDKRWKYGGGVTYYFNKKPRTFLGVWLQDDVMQLGSTFSRRRNSDNLFRSLANRAATNRLTQINQIQVFFNKEWFHGFSNMLQLERRIIHPVGTLNFNRPIDQGESEVINSIRATEISLSTHFAWKERFIEGKFKRRSIGTTKPVLDLTYSYGIPNLLGGQYEYHKLVLNYKHKLRLGPWGMVEYRAETGKYFGNLPYPLLAIHTGNETYFGQSQAFNTMNFFEFVSDQYVSAMVTYHMHGYILNKIPLIRRLNLREVGEIKSVYGTLNPKHRGKLNLADHMYELKYPFVEASIGIENIFKVFRVDFVYRLTHRNNPNSDIIKPLGIVIQLAFDF